MHRWLIEEPGRPRGLQENHIWRGGRQRRRLCRCRLAHGLPRTFAASALLASALPAGFHLPISSCRLLGRRCAPGRRRLGLQGSLCSRVQQPPVESGVPAVVTPRGGYITTPWGLYNGKMWLAYSLKPSCSNTRSSSEQSRWTAVTVARNSGTSCASTWPCRGACVLRSRPV